MQDDEEKFKYADANGDGGLDLKEYMSFYHPGVGGNRILFSGHDHMFASLTPPPLYPRYES